MIIAMEARWFNEAAKEAEDEMAEFQDGKDGIDFVANSKALGYDHPKLAQRLTCSVCGTPQR